MVSSDLTRWSGLAALLGGVLTVISAGLRLPIGGHSFIGDIATSFIYTFDSLLYMLAMIMVLGGLVGLYASQARATGLLGAVGFLVAFLGMSLVLGFWWGQAFWVPAVAEAAPELLEDDPPSGLTLAYRLTFSLASLGWLLFGFATLLARVYPRSAAILLIFGAIIGFTPFLPYLLLQVVPAIAVAWLGHSLYTAKGEEVEEVR
jgi:hypothetical protein